MRGRDALWQPGTDHAGIATQMVVERQLAAQQQNRHQMGREAFVERVWQWKAESGGMITGQQRRLGESCDWSRERSEEHTSELQSLMRISYAVFCLKKKNNKNENKAKYTRNSRRVHERTYRTNTH